MKRNIALHIILARMGGVDTRSLLPALAAEGWRVDVVESLEHLLATLDTGRHHGAIVACEDPSLLAKGAVQALLSFQGSLSLSFLVRSREDLLGCPALIGVSSDQIHTLDTPPDALLDALKNEVVLAALHEPEYTVLCVDDDREFLRSLEHFLPPRLEEAFPRFVLGFEFVDSPREALAFAAENDGAPLALVISDQVMPGMMGVDLLTQIKRLCPRAQRVLLTGHAGIDAAIQAINERALDKYFSKPIEQSADFVLAVRELVRTFHLQLSGDALRHRLMAQFEFIRVISAAFDLDRVLKVTAAFVREQAGALEASVALLEGADFIVRAAEGDPGHMPVGSSLAADEGLASWMRRHRQPLVANHPREMPPGVQLRSPVPPPLMAIPLITGDRLLGTIVVSGRPSGRPFSRDERMLMSFIADAASATLGALKDREAIEHYYVNAIASLMEAVEAKDYYTRGHTDRVMELAVRLGKEAGLSGKELTDVARAAALHDIGKIAVPESVISKPSALDPEEFALMRMHCERGAKIVRHLEFLDDARLIILTHHERYDGSGYPQGLKGEEISIGARILGIVDSYDAMTSDRPYRAAKSPEEAVAELEACAGTQFDPDLVRLFVAIVREGAEEEVAADETIV